MDVPQNLPARPGIGLAAAALLEAGLTSLESGRMPAALGSLAAIDEDAWTAILRRFPNIPDLITKWSSPR